MDKFINDVIKRIYIDKDFDFFINQCTKKIGYIKELNDISSKITTNVIVKF
jgi:hypothetical protein